MKHNPCKHIALPVLDISDQAERHVFVARGTETEWNGHPSTVLLPDGKTEVPFTGCDSFTFQDVYSTALGFVRRENHAIRSVFALHAQHNERFAGTGERFAKLDLSGRTINVDNWDAMGVNNRRAYKNVPFYVSSRPYGLFVVGSREVGPVVP